VHEFLTNCGMNLVLRDSAHVAERLRHDHVGPKLFEKRPVQTIEGTLRLESSTDQAVNFCARQVARNQRTRDPWQPRDARREVTLVTHSHELFREPKSAHNLGRARQQRNDTHTR
jgi:hypothetical protein